MLQLIEQAASDGREEFHPLRDLTAAETADLVTLPASIGALRRVRHLVLYGSPLARLPRQIMHMTGLEVFEPYQSPSLHWLPYELARCPRLCDSTVSTRALYGNPKLRPPFPRLQPRGALAAAPGPGALDPEVWGVESVRACSVCDGPLDPIRFRQVWISLPVATDVLPLLVNACSSACVDALPAPAPGYPSHPHQGGRAFRQAPPR